MTRTPADPPDGSRIEPASSEATGWIDAPGQSLHDLFQMQVSDIIDQGDLDEEQKQMIMMALNCPCCGTGSMSLRFKLKGGEPKITAPGPFRSDAVE